MLALPFLVLAIDVLMMVDYYWWARRFVFGIFSCVLLATSYPIRILAIVGRGWLVLWSIAGFVSCRHLSIPILLLLAHLLELLDKHLASSINEGLVILAAYHT
jgi:hypothetical protein